MNSAIYRTFYVNPAETVCFSGDMMTYQLSFDFILTGNYIYSLYWNYGPPKESYKNTDYYNSTSDLNEINIMRIDASTGEMSYIFCR